MGLLDLPAVVDTLPPATQAGHPGIIGRPGNDFSYRIEQQINIGRIMHIRFNHKRIAACRQRFFFFEPMSRLHHHLIDLIQDLGRKQLHIIFERLQLLGQIIIGESMP